MLKKMLIIFLIAGLSMPSLACFATSDAFDWYPKRNKDHTQPILEKHLSFLKQYKSIYVDKQSTPDQPALYLTFDVGYENGNVEKILNILKEENVPAAFFVLAHIAHENAHLLKRMQEEGHLVCNHTAKHKDMSKVSKEEFTREIKRMEELIKETTAQSIAPYYRPPMGRFNEDNLKWAEELGYTTVFWSICYADWDNQNQPSPEKAKKILLDNTHPGAIILLHPTSATNATILKELIQTWRAQGYQFASLDHIKI